MFCDGKYSIQPYSHSTSTLLCVFFFHKDPKHKKETLSLMTFAVIYNYCSCTRVQLPFGVHSLFTVSVESSFYICSAPIYLSFLVFVNPALSSGADHAVCGRDERCHWPRWDNPVAIYSCWFKGIDILKIKSFPNPINTHTHILQTGYHWP